MSEGIVDFRLPIEEQQSKVNSQRGQHSEIDKRAIGNQKSEIKNRK
jgi:hypothetical protein